VGHSDCCKEKLSQNLLSRQAKPFIDQNLQLQIPGGDSPKGERSHSPIYSHYMGDNPSISYLDSQVNENELYKAIKDAEDSYKAWQIMKEKLEAAAKAFQ